MNKKFFGALTAAGVLLSQGSPIFAQEMVEVESGSVPGTDVEQQTTVKLDEVNFPDSNFRDAVIEAYNGTTLSDGSILPGAPDVSEGSTVKTEDLAKITTLTASGNTASDEAYKTITTPTPGKYTVTYQGFKDLTGIEYLTGLQVLDLQYSPNLKVADLSDNEELVTVIIAPVPSGGNLISVTASTWAVNNVAPTDVASYGSSDLYSIILPEETTNLAYLVIEGANQLTTLDLSAYDELIFVNLENNELAQLNVEGCTSITELNVSTNDLTGLDVSTLKSLKTLTASSNNLYEVELPSGKSLKKVDVSSNKLPSIDVSGLKSLEDLNVESNRLESIDLSNNGSSLKYLNVGYNHLATLDLSNNTTLNALEASTDAYGTSGATSTLTVSPQYLYANIDDAGIDLASYDENFQASSNNLGWIANTTSNSDRVVGGTITKAGVFEFNSDIEPAAKTTGIYYLYQIGGAAVSPISSGNPANNVMQVFVAQAHLMNRLYNPNSGEHFYTADLNEKDTLVKLGWQYEGIGWVAPQENYPTTNIAAGEAVFRLYNPNAGDHHYTADSKEKDILVRAGWNYEGVGWYSTKGGYSIAVYREYNPNAKEAGAHNYTTSENENDTLVALGWLDEGIGWLALK